jgi:hypothetical protein
MGAAVVAGTAVLIALARPWAGGAVEPRLLRELGLGRRPTLSYAFEAAWWVYAPLLLALLLLALRAVRPRWPSARQLFSHPAPALVVVPILVLLNGVAPYLGLKTETAVSMFSNLRTEQGSNHFLVRRTADLAGLQGDLVRIESSRDPELRLVAARGYLLPLFELRAYVQERARIGDPDVALTSVRAGRRRSVASAGRDPELAARAPFLARALIAFRPVSAGPGSPCRH